MPVYNDGAGTYYIGTANAGLTRSQLITTLGSGSSGEFFDLLTASGIRYAVGWHGVSNPVISWSSPLGVGGEVHTGNPAISTNPNNTLSANTRICLFLWNGTSVTPVNINSGFSDGSLVNAKFSSFAFNTYYDIVADPSTRFWASATNKAFTLFGYKDADNWFSIFTGYASPYSGVVFPLNCYAFIQYKLAGVMYWTGGSPTGQGLTTITTFANTGQLNYSHVLNDRTTKDATNLAIPNAGVTTMGAKVTRRPTLPIGQVFITDETPAKQYKVVGYSGVTDSNLVFLYHANNTGSVTGANLLDECNPSALAVDYIIGGSPEYSTTISKFGGSSLKVQLNQFLATTSSLSRFDFGSGDFTIEYWFYPENTSFGVENDFILNSTTISVWATRLTSSTAIFRSYVTNIDATFSITAGQIVGGAWHHIAFSSNGGVLRFFVNGVQTGGNGVTPNISTAGLTLGNLIFCNSASPVRYYDEVAIYKGLGKYTANFTPPTVPYAPLPEFFAMNIYKP